MVRPVELRKLLEDTRIFAEFEERDYLGISQIWKCPRELYLDLVNGRERPGIQLARLFHEGYIHEADVLEQLEAAGVEVWNTGREVTAPWDGRFRGHIDGEVAGEVEGERQLLEIKSVTREKFELVMRHGPLKRHLDQARMYLRYGDYERGLIVYKEREGGDIWVCEVWRSEEREIGLEEKARHVLLGVDEGISPGCECGRCREE